MAAGETCKLRVNGVEHRGHEIVVGAGHNLTELSVPLCYLDHEKALMIDVSLTLWTMKALPSKIFF